MVALLYPATRFPQYGYKSWQEESVLRNDAQLPKFQEKDLWNRTIFRASMNYDLRTDDALVIEAFWKNNRYLAQTNQVYSFDFFDFRDGIYPIAATLGTATGAANQIFDIPGKNARNYSWYDNGSLGSNSNVVLLSGTGTNGRDQLKVVPALTAGHAVTFAYIGKGCFTCVFLKRVDAGLNNYGRLGLSVELIEKV